MAVYTHVTDADLDAFLSHYEVGTAVAFKGIAEGVENSNYFVACNKDGLQTKYILTLFEKRVDASDLPFFMGLMKALVDKGLPTAGPIADKEGTIIRYLCGRPAVLIAFVEGVSLDAPDLRNCAELGTFLANMHLAVENIGLSRPNSMSIPEWQRLTEACVPEASRLGSDVATMIAEELHFLQTHWPADKALPRGVIHADLFPDNVLLTDGNITGVIDFYFACTDFFAYDLAICITSWCFDKNFKFQPQNATAMIETYQQVRPLLETEKAALPVLLRGAALRFLLSRAYDWLHQVPDALVRVKDPLEYVSKLRYYQTLESFEDI